MAAYDGIGVFARDSDLTPDGELLYPGITHLNRSRLQDQSYGHLMRTHFRLKKYEARGIFCADADTAWISERMESLVHAPASIFNACSRGRLQEACALVLSGADPSDAPTARGYSELKRSSQIPAEYKTGHVYEFRALFTDFCQAHDAERTLARSLCISRTFTSGMRSLPTEASCIVAKLVSGFGGSLEQSRTAIDAMRVSGRWEGVSDGTDLTRIAALKHYQLAVDKCSGLYNDEPSYDDAFPSPADEDDDEDGDEDGDDADMSQ